MSAIKKTAKSASKVSSRSHLEEQTPRLRFPGFEGAWKHRTMGVECSFFSGGTPNSTDAELYNGTIPFIRSAEIDATETALYLSEKGLTCSSSKLVEVGDLLLAMYGANSGDVAISKINGAINQAILCIRSATLKTAFIKFYLERDKAKITSKYLQGGQGNLSAEIIKELTFPFPQNNEQNKIISFIVTIEKRITAQRRLVELLKKHKRGVRSDIFEGKLRVPCQGKKLWQKWEVVKIGDIFDERSERGGSADELLSVTINFGVKRQSDTEKKDSSSEDKANYKRVAVGDIVYNTMRMWQGASGVSPWAGIVSPAYTVIYPKKHQNTTFWAYAFKHRRLVQTFQKFSQGLTSDTWNLKFPQLADIKVKIPSLEEQNAIVEFLLKLDSQVTAAEKKLEKLTKMKSGFLQQLFV